MVAWRPFSSSAFNPQPFSPSFSWSPPSPKSNISPPLIQAPFESCCISHKVYVLFIKDKTSDFPSGLAESLEKHLFKMAPAIDIAILPYLQAWRSSATDSFLDIRILSTPRGSPVDPFDGATGKSFAAADFKLEVHVQPSDDLPTLTGTPLLTVDSPAPSNSLALFKELANQLAAKGLSIGVYCLHLKITI